MSASGKAFLRTLSHGELSQVALKVTAPGIRRCNQSPISGVCKFFRKVLKSEDVEGDVKVLLRSKGEVIVELVVLCDLRYGTFGWVS